MADSDIRELLRRGVSDPSGDVPVGPIRTRGSRRRSRRRLGAAAVGLVGGVAVLVAVGQLQTHPVEFAPASPGPMDGEHRAADEEPVRSSEVVTAVQGTVAGTGEPWALRAWLAEGELLCLELRGIVCGSASIPDQPLWFTLLGGQSEPERACVAGPVTMDVAMVRLDLPTGEKVEVEPERSSLDVAARFFAHCWDGAIGSPRITLLGEDGAIVEEVD